MVRIGNDADDTSSTSTDEEEFINSITPQVSKKPKVVLRLDSDDALDTAIKGKILLLCFALIIKKIPHLLTRGMPVVLTQ